MDFQFWPIWAAQAILKGKLFNYAILSTVFSMGKNVFFSFFTLLRSHNMNVKEMKKINWGKIGYPFLGF